MKYSNCLCTAHSTSSDPCSLLPPSSSSAARRLVSHNTNAMFKFNIDNNMSSQYAQFPGKAFTWVVVAQTPFHSRYSICQRQKLQVEHRQHRILISTITRVLHFRIAIRGISSPRLKHNRTYFIGDIIEATHLLNLFSQPFYYRKYFPQWAIKIDVNARVLEHVLLLHQVAHIFLRIFFFMTYKIQWRTNQKKKKNV